MATMTPAQKRTLQAAVERAKAAGCRILSCGVPTVAILPEDGSLHTKQAAYFIVPILAEQRVQSVILTASPFHQLRTYLTFAKEAEPRTRRIINYHADTYTWLYVALCGVPPYGSCQWSFAN